MTQRLSAPFVRFRPRNSGWTPTRRRYKERMLAVVVIAVWFTLAVGDALIISAGIRVAERRAPFNDHLAGLPQDLTVDDVLGVRTAF